MFLLKHYVRRHGLRTPNDAFFFKIPNFCAWADKFWGIWGIFKQFISTHFGTNVCFKKTWTNNNSDRVLQFVQIFLKQTLVASGVVDI